MGFFNFVGGLANSYNSALKTQEDMADRDALKEDRDFIRGNRKQATDERDRANADRIKKEGFQKSLSGILSTEKPVAAADPKVLSQPDADQALEPAATDATLPEQSESTAAPVTATTPAATLPAPANIPAAPASASVMKAPLAAALPTGTPAAAVTPRETTRVGGMNSIKTMREIAASALKFDQVDQFMKFNERADAMSWKQSANSLLQLRANSANMSPLQLMERAGEIFGSDIGSGSIEKPTQNADGSISFVSVNGVTGQKFKRTVKTVDEALDQLSAFYTPENYTAVQAEKAKNQLEIAKEQAKPYKLSPGETQNIGNKVINTNTNEPTAVQTAKITAQGRINAAGLGGKNGKKSYGDMTPHEQSMSLIEDSSKDAEGAYKLTPDQTLTAKDMSGEVLDLNTNMSPQKAASISVRVTADPSLVAPTLDMANGYVVGAYRDPNSGTRTSVYKFPQERITDDVKDALKLQIPSLLSSLNSQAQGLGPLVQRAAFGDAGASAQIYSTLLQQNKVQLAQQFTSAGRPAPSDAQLTQAAQRHMDRNAMPLINRQIALVAAYGDKPAAQKGAQGAAGAGGGTRSIANTLDYVPPVNSIAGRSQSRRQANRAEADQAAAAQASRDQALASALQVKANAALRAANPEARMRAAQEIQESPDFDLLSTDSKLRISNAVNGR